VLTVTISDLELAARLRDLRVRADSVPPPPADLAGLTRDRYRAERRRRIAVGAGTLVAAVVLVGLPSTLSGLTQGPSGGETARPSHAAPAVTPGLYEQPTRGSLAGDREWLDAVRGLPWTPAATVEVPTGVLLPDPAAGSRRVAFAGDVPTGRITLVLGMDGNQLAHAWFLGPVGAEPDEMALAALPSTAGPDQPIGLLDAPAEGAADLTLVLVGLPGDTADRGVTPVADAAGEVHDSRVAVPLDDGVAVTTLPTPSPWADVRIWRSGDHLGAALDTSDRLTGGPSAPQDWAQVTPADPRGLLGRVSEQVELTVGGELSLWGLSAEQARPTLLAVGPLGRYVGTYGELYGFTHPSGAITLWVVTYTPGNDNVPLSQYEMPPLSAGEGLMDRVLAVQASAGVLISAPRGVSAEVLAATGQVLAVVPLENGAGTGPMNATTPATVRILDAAGNAVGEAPLVGRSR
jgi:hypothetical protein